MSIDPNTVFLVSAVLAGLYFAIDQAIAYFNNTQRKRMHKVATRAANGMLDLHPAVNVRKDTANSSLHLLDQMIKKYMPNAASIRKRLRRAGMKMDVGQYVLINLLTTFAAVMIVQHYTGISYFLALLSGLAIGLLLPKMYVTRAIGKRQRKFIEQFPEAIDLIVRGLRSGLPISESIKTIAAEMPPPVSEEFGQVKDRLQLGDTLNDILIDTARKLDLPEFNFFVIALSIQQETGGNLAETLENLSDVLRRRKGVQLKIKAMSAEAKMSAYIIGSLPFIMFGLLMQMNPGYMMMLIEDPRGNMLMAVALGMIGIDAFVMRKMVRFDI